MILKSDLSKELLIKRIPFLRKFQDYSGNGKIHLHAESYNNNITFELKGEIISQEHVNHFIDFMYSREQINDNYFFHFNVKLKTVMTKPSNLDDLTFRILIMVAQQFDKDISLHKEFISKQEHLTPEQLNEAIEECNKRFFQIDEHLTDHPLGLKNPLDEGYKKQIFEGLIRLTEDIQIPQDYSKEFNQTGSGKAIQGKPNIAQASPSDLRKAKARMAQAHLLNQAYKEAYANGQPDQNGTIHFQAEFQGRLWDCQIPPQFKNKSNTGERPVDYRYYFDYPDLGDGAFQVALDKNGFIQAKNLRSKPDMDSNPNLSQASDAGYTKEFNGTIKYMDVRAGVLGKEGQGRYSILPTPAMDAAVKVNIAFQTEIQDFMQGGGDYTADNKGKELANASPFDMKMKKVKKDAEAIVGRQLTGNPAWETFKKGLLQTINTPEEQEALDVDTATRTFIKHFKQSNQIKKPEISLPQDDMADFEKRQAMLRDRLAAARNRRK